MINQHRPALFLTIALAASTFAAAQPHAQEVALSLEQQTALRCSAAFAMVASGQARGEAGMARYPALGARGREYMVRSSARLMDDAGLTREQIAGMLEAEVLALREEGRLDAIMPPCLALLDASGL